jgi:hypothetical protein
LVDQPTDIGGGLFSLKAQSSGPCDRAAGQELDVPLDLLPLTKSQRRLLRRLDELLTWGEIQLSGHPLPDDLPLNVLAQLTGAMHRMSRGILAQVRGGSVDGLEGMVRSMIEALISIRYIFADQTEARALAFVVDDIRSRKRMARRVVGLMDKGKAPSMASISTIDGWRQAEAKLTRELAQMETRYGKDDLKWPSIERRAELGDSEELYATAFWLFSQDEHLSTRGLDRFMRQRGGSIYFDLGHDLERLDSFVGMACVYYLAFLGELSDRAGHPSRRELERFNSLADHLRQEASPK